MEFFNVVSVKQARAKIKDIFKGLKTGPELVCLHSLAGRVLYQGLISNLNIPSFDRSTVDGYALKSADTQGSSETIPVILEMTGEVEMGKCSNMRLMSGQAVYVPTGGMLPKGADSVIMIEHVNVIDGQTIEVNRPVAPGENIMFTGDDIKKGRKLFDRGRRLSAADIGVFAALGIDRAMVFKRPRVSIISTGDEIIGVSEKSGPGKVRDINGHTLSGLVRESGGEIIIQTIVRDDMGLLKEAVENALESSNIILISGGSSVGSRDYTKDIINSFEDTGVFVHGISMKPGKPTLIGEVKGKAVFGLPGHPVSAIMVYKVFVEYLINLIMECRTDQSPWCRALLSSNVHSSPGSTTYKMVTLSKREGRLFADISYGKSGMITLLAGSSGFIEINDETEGLYKGEEVDVYKL